MVSVLVFVGLVIPMRVRVAQRDFIWMVLVASPIVVRAATETRRRAMLAPLMAPTYARVAQRAITLTAMLVKRTFAHVQTASQKQVWIVPATIAGKKNVLLAVVVFHCQDPSVSLMRRQLTMQIIPAVCPSTLLVTRLHLVRYTRIVVIVSSQANIRRRVRVPMILILEMPWAVKVAQIGMGMIATLYTQGMKTRWPTSGRHAP